MKRTIILLAFAMGISIAGCKPSDEQIQDDVNTKLASTSPGVNGAVANGVVTLTGQVADQTAKEDAANEVQDIKGVKKVDNQVNIATISAAAPVPAQVIISPDSALRKSIDSGFTANNIQGITAAVNDGTVTLTGTTPKAGLRKIMEVVHEAHPKKVKNDLTLK